MTIIRQATQADAEQYRELRLRALKKHPEAFGSDYTETLARPLEGWHAMLRPIPVSYTHLCAYKRYWHLTEYRSNAIVAPFL